jgi:hypothetical protein
VVRSGPTAPVTFGGAHECRGRQPEIAVNPDDALVGDGVSLADAVTGGS